MKNQPNTPLKYALQISNVQMGYNKNPVINDINLHVECGEFFGLIGLNGVGKTTLIKAILNLKTTMAGEVKVFGHAAGSKEGRQKIAYLPERFDPPWFLTGLEFVKFSLRLYNQKFDKNAVIKMAEKLALDPDALKRKAGTYSKGMRQKLGLIGTIMTKCPLLILDEPMSGLDPRARSLVKDMLIHQRKNGQTIFLSSHILADMDEICDRVTILDQGEIRFTDKPAALRTLTGKDNLECAFLHYVENNHMRKKAA